MKLIRSILLATDFKHESLHVVEAAILLKKAFDCEIFILHVLPNRANEPEIRDKILQAVEQKFEQIEALFDKQGVKEIHRVLEFGNIFEQIIRTAERKRVNLILMGSGVSTGTYNLSTTTSKVISKTKLPVWVVKKNSPRVVKRILCPVDFSDPSSLSFENAIHLARRCNAELNVMSVFEPLDIYTEGIEFKCDRNDLKLEAYFMNFKAFLKNFNLEGVKFKKTHKSGIPYLKIFEVIGQYKPDLLMMGTNGKTGLSKILIGSVTEKVIREVPCSFITTKTKNFIHFEVTSQIRDLDYHYQNAIDMIQDGYVKEALDQFHICLDINNMHLPSLLGLAKTYKSIGENEKSLMFQKLASEIMSKSWDPKIEKNTRKHYSL